jgi:putative hemolysin
MNALFQLQSSYPLYRLGRLPAVGDTFSDRTGHYEIVDMDGRRIDKLIFTPRPEEEG